MPTDIEIEIDEMFPTEEEIQRFKKCASSKVVPTVEADLKEIEVTHTDVDKCESVQVITAGDDCGGFGGRGVVDGSGLARSPNQVLTPQNATISQQTDLDNAEADFNYARKKIKSALDQADQALDTAAQLAAQSGDPEVISSFAGLLKGVTDGSSKLLDLHTKLKALKKSDNSNSSNETNITNNTMILTTDEMLKLIKKEIHK